MQSHKVSYALAAAVALSFCVPAAMAADSAASGLKACAALKSSSARLSCYDQLAKAQHPATKTVKSPAKPEAQKATAKPAAPAAEAPKPVTAVKPAAVPPAKKAPARTIPTVPAAQKTPAQFGSELLPMPKKATDKKVKATEPKAIDHITEAVSKVKYTLRGHFIITLANGQIWRQINSETEHVRFPHHATVTITRGLVGGYNLTIGESNRLYKVHRIK